MTRSRATIILVRHALAGSRTAWAGPDHMRPLDDRGTRQARAIAATLKGLAPDRLLTSSSVRCIDTLEPFATASGLDVQVHDALIEGAPAAEVEALLDSLAGRVVLCTHGDICRLVTIWANGIGLPIPAGAETEKGATWILDRDLGTARLVPTHVDAPEQV